jgi:hypothetical protein
MALVITIQSILAAEDLTIAASNSAKVATGFTIAIYGK